MTEQEWNEYKKKSRSWAIRMTFELLHSKAYQVLNYAPALKVLSWFHEKLRFEVDKKRRGKERYRIINDGEMKFPYREAGFRGLTPHRFRNALIKLHRVGFIDVKKAGSALKGDETIFLFSERWKKFGTPDFVEREFPRSVYWVNFGFGAKKGRHNKKLDVRIDN